MVFEFFYNCLANPKLHDFKVACQNLFLQVLLFFKAQIGRLIEQVRLIEVRNRATVDVHSLSLFYVI